MSVERFKTLSSASQGTVIFVDEKKRFFSFQSGNIEIALREIVQFRKLYGRFRLAILRRTVLVHLSDTNASEKDYLPRNIRSFVHSFIHSFICV